MNECVTQSHFQEKKKELRVCHRDGLSTLTMPLLNCINYSLKLDVVMKFHFFRVNNNK